MSREELTSEEIIEILGYNKKNPYCKHVTVTVEGKGKEGAREASKLVEMMKRLREVKVADNTTEKGKTTTRLYARRKRCKHIPSKTEKETRFPTNDGNLLVLTESLGGINVTITEDTRPNSRTTLKNLVLLIRYLTDSNPEVHYENLGDVENERLTAIFHIRTLDRETAKQRIRQIYENLCVSLLKKLEDVEKQRRANIPSLLDDIRHYKGLPVNPLEAITSLINDIQRYDGLALSHLEVEKLKEDILLGYFTRALLGTVSARIRTDKHPNGVAVSEIMSKRKSRDVAMARIIAMYVMKKAYPKLSSSDIGRIFGPPGEPKNHATVLLATKERGERKNFDPEAGNIRPSDYSLRKNDGMLKIRCRYIG